MTLFGQLKQYSHGRNLVFLITLALAMFLLLVIFLSINHAHNVEHFRDIIVDGELESHKMELNSELMEVARTRTLLTARIIDTRDVFEQDELNMELERYAGRFASLRSRLLELELTRLERQILEHEHPKIIPVILPAQRRAVELAMSGEPAKIQEAREIMYEVVFPGQAKLIELFGRMIKQEQAHIKQSAESAHMFVDDINQNSLQLTGSVLAGISILSAIVIFRVKRIQQALLDANANLEQTVEQRTRELSDTASTLQRSVDMVDKHVITMRIDAGGKITYASDAFQKISKYPEDELIGSSHGLVCHPDMPSIEKEVIREVIGGGKAWQGETHCIARDGTEYWVDRRIEPQFDEHGRPSGYIDIQEDITDKKRIERLSVTDPLTKLCNRLKLDSTLRQETQRARRYRHPLSVIVLDIDHFKQINDTWGHLSGDEVLVTIADIIRSRIRNTDIAGRWGGEEFIVICPDTDTTGVAELAEELRMAISGHEFKGIGCRSCSFGIATYSNVESVDQLLGRADNALYRAKQNGRNRVESADALHDQRDVPAATLKKI